jgi:hypothetical protein
MSSAGGKGSTRRPSQISEEEENAKWDLIFKKPKLDNLVENPKEEPNEQHSPTD